ncbi:AAA family ATPase [Pseudomonas sp.]|uniref:AAA family ATPase n=1 Tax=Pseudomonas sp. TaxID=306 RepID=UPI002FC92B88
MDPTKKYPQAPESAEGSQYNEQSNVSAEYTFTSECMQGHFVAWRRVWDPDREVWKKVPHNGGHGVSTKRPEQWTTLEHAQALVADPDNDLAGIGLVMTGGIREGDYTLVGIDVDDATAGFVLPFDTYTETSPSGEGYRAFLWLPTAKAALLRDTRLDDVPDCDHVEVYLGSAPRFLTLTFDQPNGRPIAYLDDLGPWKLKAAVNTISNARPITPGTLLDLDGYQFKKSIFQLLDGEGQPVINRSDEVYNLIIALAEQGASQEDILATLIGTDATWLYLMDHRNDNPERAKDFAKDEVNTAYPKAMAPRVKDLFASARQFQPPHDRQPLAEMMEAKARGFEAPYLAALWSEDVTPDWLIDNVLENMAITEIWGPSQAFKSFVAIDMSTAITSGQDWHGNPTRRQGEVLYIPGEGRRNIVRRIRGACQKRGLGRDQKIRVANMPCRLSVFEQYKWLREYIADLPAPPILIVIDTLARNYGGNENSAEDMGRFTDHLGDLIREFRCAVLLIHHCGRDGKHARGSYALDAGVDAEYEAIANNDPNNRTLLLENHKMKDGESGKKFAFNMKLITLKDDNGNDLQKDGQPVDTLVLESGASVHALEQAEFFKDHPEFRSKGKSLIEQRLPLVLRYAYASPGMGARAMAGVVTPTLRDHSWAANMHKLMVDADLVEGDGFTLTEAGKQAAIVFDCRARFVEAGKDLPATPTLTVEKVARSAQLL